MPSLGELLVSIGADISGFETAMEQVSVKAGKAMDEVNTKFSGLEKLGSALTGAGAALSVGITAPLAAIAGLGVSASASIESLRMGLTAVTGSAEETNRQFERLLEIAKLPGLGFEEAVRGSIALQAVGLSAEESERYLRAFGNALATVGRGSADLQGVIVQLQQMSAKAKVVAADVRPIVERVPQIAAIMREQFGTVDTEIIQKMGVSTKQFLEVIVRELEKLPLVTGGIANAFENIRDQATQTFAKIGDILAPVVRKVIDNFLVPLLDGLGSLAEWFAKLPAPVQAFAGTLAALAAAAGPVLLAVGGIATGISTFATALAPLAAMLGTSVLALGGWAVAIAGVTAALAALGVWVYQNWESVKAVLHQAWDGVAEAWQWAWSGITDWLVKVWTGIVNLIGPIWNPIINFFSRIWDGIATVYSFAWEGIKESLIQIWNAIKASASYVWGGIVSVFQTFLEWAAKIPGVNKLFTLDEAWNSAKKLKEQTEQLNTAINGSEKGMKSLAAAHNIGAASIAKTTKAKEAFRKVISKTTPELEIQAAMMRKDVQERNRLIQQIAKGRLHMEREADTVRVLTDGLDELNAVVARSVIEHRDFANINPVVTQAIQGTSTAVDDYYDILQRAGIKSVEEFDRIASEAERMYERIANDPRATKWETDNALLRMLRAQADAMRAHGERIPNDMSAMMERLESEVGSGSKRVTSEWDDMCRSIDRSVTDLSTSLVQSLWEGDFSFKDKGIKALKGIGEAVTAHFVTPATKAISGFISGTIADLLGGKGLGGVLDRLKGIGSAISSIFGTGPGEVVSGTAGAAGSAGTGTAGTAAGAGVTGVLGVIGSIGSMATGIIGAFQNARQEKTLNAIEESTRYVKIWTGEQSDSILETLHVIRNELTDFFAAKVGFGTLVDLTTRLTYALVWGEVKGDNPLFVQIKEGIFNIADSARRIAESAASFMAPPAAMVAAPAGGGSITFNITGNTIAGESSIDWLVDMIMQRLQEQRAFV